MIPEISTDRLILRGPVEADFDSVAAYTASPRSIFTGGPNDDPFAAWRGFLGVLGHWSLRSYGLFMVTLKDGTRIGRAGVIHHIMWEEPELGWHLFDGFEGHGYATEAALAARDWATHARDLGPLVSYIHPDNEKSRGVARRLGAVHERDGQLLGHPAQIWRHQRPEQ